MENKTIDFKISKELYYQKNSEELKKLAIRACPDGWEPDLYFNSKDSFFTAPGTVEDIYYASCVIRRWV